MIGDQTALLEHEFFQRRTTGALIVVVLGLEAVRRDGFPSA